MHNQKYDKQFKEQQNEIFFRTVILCQDRESIPKAKEWLKLQIDIPYLPKYDMFAYYCPMCNNILSIGCKCKICGQLIDWQEDMKPKLINDNKSKEIV